MLASLLGVTMALVLQQGDTFRQHIEQPIVCLYAGDDSSIWYMQRHSGKFVAGAEWSAANQYGA